MEINLIKDKLSQFLIENGYELCSISYGRKDGANLLSVVVDRVAPIDMDAITAVSEKISSYLDEIDASSIPYTLDVSSLGAEKPLKIESLKDYVGQYVNVHVINPIDGANIFEGDLIEAGSDSISIEIKIKTRVKKVNILVSNIYKIRLAIKF